MSIVPVSSSTHLQMCHVATPILLFLAYFFFSYHIWGFPRIVTTLTSWSRNIAAFQIWSTSFCYSHVPYSPIPRFPDSPIPRFPIPLLPYFILLFQVYYSNSLFQVYYFNVLFEFIIPIYYANLHFQSRYSKFDILIYYSNLVFWFELSDFGSLLCWSLFYCSNSVSQIYYLKFWIYWTILFLFLSTALFDNHSISQVQHEGVVGW